jgi:hypothetical protein
MPLLTIAFKNILRQKLSLTPSTVMVMLRKMAPRPVRLLIYIDDSHEMTTLGQAIKDDGRNVYQTLCLSLHELAKVGSLLRLFYRPTLHVEI